MATAKGSLSAGRVVARQVRQAMSAAAHQLDLDLEIKEEGSLLDILFLLTLKGEKSSITRFTVWLEEFVKANNEP